MPVCLSVSVVVPLFEDKPALVVVQPQRGFSFKV